MYLQIKYKLEHPEECGINQLEALTLKTTGMGSRIKILLIKTRIETFLNRTKEL
jgi:hypothetical protein